MDLRSRVRQGACSALLLPLLCLPIACTPTTGGVPAQPVPHAALIAVAVSLGTSVFLADRPQLAPLVYRIAHDAASATEGALDVTQLGPTLQAAIARVPASEETRIMAVFLVHIVLSEVQHVIDRAKLAPTQVQLLASDIFAAMERAAKARMGGLVPVVGG